MEFLKELRISFNLTQDELSKKLMIEDRTLVSQYETRANPSIKVLLQYAELFGLTFDFIVLNKNCNYPHNLRLLTLAKSFDSSDHLQSRGLIEASADVFLKEMNNNELKQDSIEIELTHDFHSNLKSLRSYKGLSQLELGRAIEVGRTAITQYENNIFPTQENLQKLSELFNVSMHAFLTGQKLIFQFTDGHFGKTMLLSDRFLPLEKHSYLIDLMENILQKQGRLPETIRHNKT